MTPRRALLLTNASNGIAACLLFCTTFALAGVPFHPGAASAALVAAVLAYSFFRPPAAAVRPFALAFMLAAVGYLHAWIAVYLPDAFVPWKKGMLYPFLVAGLALFALYHPQHYRVRRTKFSFRNSVWKNGVIAWAWTAFTLAPWMLASEIHDEGLGLHMGSRFLLIFSFSLLSDLADVTSDPSQNRSLSARLGIRGLRAAAFLSALGAEAFALNTGLLPGIFIAPVIVSLSLCRVNKKWRNEWIIDGAIAAHCALLIAFA
jgi:hypothetical protein